jgi:hypothetical protein
MSIVGAEARDEASYGQLSIQTSVIEYNGWKSSLAKSMRNKRLQL